MSLFKGVKCPTKPLNSNTKHQIPKSGVDFSSAPMYICEDLDNFEKNNTSRILADPTIIIRGYKK